MIDEFLRESGVAQLLMEEARAAGEAEGRAAGEAEGRAAGRAAGEAEGRAQAARAMARLALEGRFGTLTDDMLAALSTVDEATLQTLVAHVTSDTLEQARARLGLGAPTQP